MNDHSFFFIRMTFGMGFLLISGLAFCHAWTLLKDVKARIEMAAFEVEVVIQDVTNQTVKDAQTYA